MYFPYIHKVTNFLSLLDDMSHVKVILFEKDINFVYVSFKLVKRHKNNLIETINTSKGSVKAANEDFVYI